MKRIIDQQVLSVVTEVIASAIHSRPYIEIARVLNALQQLEVYDEEKSWVQSGSEENSSERGSEPEISGSNPSELNAEGITSCEEGQSCS